MPDSQNENNGKNEWRLQHYMALCGVASRRASETIIAEGRVSVNGVTVTTPGTKVTLSEGLRGFKANSV